MRARARARAREEYYSRGEPRDFQDEVAGSGRSWTRPDGLEWSIGRLLDAVAVGTATLAGERATQLETGVHGDHLGQDLQYLLGHGLVVYRDEVLGLRVHLEGLVESESRLDLLGACN